MSAWGFSDLTVTSKTYKKTLKKNVKSTYIFPVLLSSKRKCNSFYCAHSFVSTSGTCRQTDGKQMRLIFSLRIQTGGPTLFQQNISKSQKALHC